MKVKFIEMKRCKAILSLDGLYSMQIIHFGLLSLFTSALVLGWHWVQCTGVITGALARVKWCRFYIVNQRDKV